MVRKQHLMRWFVLRQRQQAVGWQRIRRQIARGGRKGVFWQERRSLQQCRPASHALLEVDEAERRRREDSEQAEGQNRFRSRRCRQDARTRFLADPRLRRVGALVLYRLSQPTSRLHQSYIKAFSIT